MEEIFYTFKFSLRLDDVIKLWQQTDQDSTASLTCSRAVWGVLDVWRGNSATLRPLTLIFHIVATWFSSWPWPLTFSRTGGIFAFFSLFLFVLLLTSCWLGTKNRIVFNKLLSKGWFIFLFIVEFNDTFNTKKVIQVSTNIFSGVYNL